MLYILYKNDAHIIIICIFIIFMNNEGMKMIRMIIIIIKVTEGGWDPKDEGAKNSLIMSGCGWEWGRLLVRTFYFSM